MSIILVNDSSDATRLDYDKTCNGVLKSKKDNDEDADENNESQQRISRAKAKSVVIQMKRTTAIKTNQRKRSQRRG